jgi:hypothetical protein
VSAPNTSSEIIDVLRNRITATAARDIQSMTGGPAAHPRAVTFHSSRTNPNQLTWTFPDEQGQAWRGVGLVERDSVMTDRFRVALSVARAARSTRA